MNTRSKTNLHNRISSQSDEDDSEYYCKIDNKHKDTDYIPSPPHINSSSLSSSSDNEEDDVDNIIDDDRYFDYGKHQINRQKWDKTFHHQSCLIENCINKRKLDDILKENTILRSELEQMTNKYKKLKQTKDK